MAEGSERRPPACLRAALGYLERGWSVVPIRRGTKQPPIRWEPYQRARPAEETVRGWYARWPDAGVGIVTGTVSGLVVLDVDPANGGAESQRELEARHGALPATVEVRTGGGGWHLYFAQPEEGPAVRSDAALAPGIDVRGAGGLVVAPPSLHASGHLYGWRVGRSPDEIAVAPLPEWLVTGLRAEHPRRAGHTLAHWRTLVTEGVTEGVRNETVASLTGHLLWHGVDPEVALELLLAWNRARCRPPLPDEEVARTVESIVRTDRRHRAERAREEAQDGEP